MRRVALVALVLVLAPAAPVARAQEDARLDTRYDDRDAGERVAREVEANLGLVDDPALVAYVTAIGRRLARHAPGFGFDYRFAIVDQDEPNAFALPGGYIFVSRGLIALCNREDELANVLGHEIVHASMRHAAAREQVGGAGFFQWFRQGQIAAYGRGQERTADRLGQGVAALAGWDPAAMAPVLKNIEFTERVRRGRTPMPGFLDTHPGTAERVAAASERAGVIAWKPAPGVARDRADFLRRIEGLTVGASASEGVFRGSRFLHADLGFTLRFPEGWETRNTHRAVGALAPTRDGQVILEHQGPGRDARAAAREWIAKAGEKARLRVDAQQPVKLRGAEAWRVTGRAAGSGGPVRLVVTWVPFRGQVYRVTGVAPSGPSRRYEGLFLNVARSFRPLTPELLASVEETRLHVVAARPGESLAQLSRRTGNAWPVQQTAVMNGVVGDVPLPAGELVKIALREPYQPAAPRR